MPHRLFMLVSIVWAGSLWTIGYIAAPTLFAMLPDRQVAGMIAGNLFRTEAIIGAVAGIVLLTLSNLMVRRGESAYRPIRWLVLAMLACTLIGHFGLQPFMSALRDKALAQGVPVMMSAYSEQFSLLHGISSAIYFVQSVLAFALIWRLMGRMVNSRSLFG